MFVFEGKLQVTFPHLHDGVLGIIAVDDRDIEDVYKRQPLLKGREQQDAVTGLERDLDRAHLLAHVLRHALDLSLIHIS